MPMYSFQNKNTKEVFEKFMSINEVSKYLEENPNIKQMVSSPPISSGRGMGKPDESFRDLLKDMKKKHSQGMSGSTINTF